MRNSCVFVALALLALPGCQMIEGEAEQRVRSVLKDADSAIFKDVRTFRYEWLGKQHWMTCGSVNAKNSFGALAGFLSFIVQDGVSGAFVSDTAGKDLNATLCCSEFRRATSAAGNPANDAKVYETCQRLSPEFRLQF